MKAEQAIRVRRALPVTLQAAAGAEVPAAEASQVLTHSNGIAEAVPWYESDLSLSYEPGPVTGTDSRFESFQPTGWPLPVLSSMSFLEWVYP